MRNLDFTSWQSLISTLLGLAVITLIGVGIRIMVMQTIQQRRERENRQINERLRILIAAYKTLGGSFTGELMVDPFHLRDLKRRSEESGEAELSAPSERTRRMRDAVEAALSDIVLLGTEEQVALAAQAANELVAGRRIETAALVVSLRNFIRGVLDLEPVAASVAIPKQGPSRPGVGSKDKGEKGKDDARGGKGGGGGGGNDGMGAGAGVGLGAGLGIGAHGLSNDDHDPGR
ncbi:hypothetical protein [uncultured Nevskia sp.]|uniref:hypothetical protein n=1 Tax=uncultured Nevskia sp. TaxID=228950 RepID=UPI0025E22D0C|nr:hypothetical protein [uncultured Nevskia sp.]